LVVALAHLLGTGGDRLHDVVVAGAAAEIAFELVPDGVIVEVVTFAGHHVDRGHDHAGSAVAALQAMMLAERFLHRMQRPVRIGPKGLDFRTGGPSRRPIGSKSGRFCPVFYPETSLTLNLQRPAGQGHSTDSRCRDQPAATAAANFTKKSSAVFFAALLISRWP